MSNQEQPTTSAQGSNERFPNPDWDSTCPRYAIVQADHYQFIPGKVLQAALDKNGGQEIKIGDLVSLEYSNGRLTAVKKIQLNAESGGRRGKKGWTWGGVGRIAFLGSLESFKVIRSYFGRRCHDL